MGSIRVCSVLPSATETLCIFGGDHLLVGRSHEDDYPTSITNLPILTASKTVFTNSADVDRQVTASLGQYDSLYTINEDLLKSLAPTIILTQDVCAVCAIDLRTVNRIALLMDPVPIVITLDPSCIQDVLKDIQIVGAAVGMQREAQLAVDLLTQRIDRAVSRADFHLMESKNKRKRVLFLEWVDPVFPAGHWTAQLIHMAGGDHVFDHLYTKKVTKTGDPSVRLTEKQVEDSNPDIVIVAPCGLDLEVNEKELKTVVDKNTWWSKVAVDGVKIVLVDGNQMFNRPGPRLVDALEFMVAYFWDDDKFEYPSDFPFKQ